MSGQPASLAGSSAHSLTDATPTDRTLTDATPASKSVRLPAEWEPQSALWLAWPHNQDTWPGQITRAGKSVARFDSIPPLFRRLARLIAEDTPVRILGRAEHADSSETQAANIQWVDIPTNDCWIRDYGPTFVIEKSANSVSSIKAVDWRYNAWGGKYPPWNDDDEATEKIAKFAGVPIEREELCLEGGALETDGRGRLLAIESCLVTPTRNPNSSREQIEQRLRIRLGLNEIVWLTGSLEGDDTDGHVDQLVRFIDPENVVVASCGDESDNNFQPLEDLRAQLCRWAETTQPSVNIHRLPVPPPRSIDGQRVPESYCNFLWLGRDRLLVPTFGRSQADDRALGILRNLSPKTDVVGFDCKDLVWGLGAIHCASRDQPKCDGGKL